MSNIQENRTLDNSFDIRFQDIFDLKEIQKMQDLIADTTGLASIITHPDGTPITQPSNFSYLCQKVVRNTEKGRSGCFLSYSELGVPNPSGSTIRPCHTCGLMEAGAAITVGGKHLANWMLGQVRYKQDGNEPMNYADEFGVKNEEFQDALDEIQVIDPERFQKLSKLLFAFANQLSEKAFSNLQLKMQMAEHEKAATLLKESEEVMRYIINHDPNAIAVYDRNLHYIAVSQRYLNDYGVVEDDIIGKHHYEVFPEMPQRWKDIHQQCLQGEIIKNDDDYFERPDGSITYNRWECRPWRRSNGEIGGMITYTEVTTERKKAEKALRESEEKYRTFFENSNDAILLTKPDGEIISVNEAACQMFGFSEEQFQKLGRDQLSEANDVQLTKLLSERDLKGKAKGEVNFLKKDGTSFTAEVSTSVFTNSDGLECSNMIIRDITERKQAEETFLKLSSTVEQTIDSVMITDRNGTIEYVNKSFELVTGYTSEEAIGQNPRIIKSGFRDQAFYQNMWEVILSGNVFREEVVNKKKNGELYHEEKTISPIFGKNGQITHFIGTGVDITERKKAEKELIKAKEKAEESDRLKSAFLANMSHEVRTPLNSIIGFSELLADADFEEDQRKEFIQHIITNGNNLLSIISDIMDISKLESGEITIRKSQINAAKFLSDIKDHYAYQAESQKLGLQVNLPDNHAGTLLMADGERLRQIFNNLVSNAFKFTSNGSIEIGYTTNNKEFEFFVKDSGIGIAPDFHDKIFERFRQVEAEKTRKYGGNGLGLAITKNLVELMGGKIWLESELGKGSTFYFSLPA